MYDIIALGEALIDFTHCGRSESGMRLFEQNPGGAVANVAAQAARLGRRTAFLGKVGDDMHGRFLEEMLAGVGIDTSGLVRSVEAFTTLAFVSLSESGERTFSFARKPGADTLLRVSEIDKSVLTRTRILHVGSLSLTDEPSREATLYAVTTAKAAGALISYDPNYRAALWPDEETAKAHIRCLLPYADIVKLSDEETSLLTDADGPEAAAERLVEKGVRCAVVTLGSRGAFVHADGVTLRVPGFCVPVSDTTGAGDAFTGAFLSRMLECGLRLDAPDPSIVADCAVFANAAAALCVQKHGAIPAMADRSAVLSLLSEQTPLDH